MSSLQSPTGEAEGASERAAAIMSSTGPRKVILGVCAMYKKTKSKPMRQILDRLRAYGEFEVIIFREDAILNDPVDTWPIVHCLISFCSAGFPHAKVCCLLLCVWCVHARLRAVARVAHCTAPRHFM